MRPIQDGLLDIRVSDKREPNTVFPLHARHSQVRPPVGQFLARDLPQQPPAPKQGFKLVVIRYEREHRVIHQGHRVDIAAALSLGTIYGRVTGYFSKLLIIKHTVQL